MSVYSVCLVLRLTKLLCLGDTMQRRAFVAMPFGRRPSAWEGIDVDFDRVFKELFEPALRRAGFDVIRADSERAAGDIRTDMFFELVTADLVVADVSIVNGNVFYELGVRHGVCPRGVIVVGNDSRPKAPFDIAQDRIFTYEAAPFMCPVDAAGGIPNAPKPGVTASIEILSKTFKDASALDAQTIGSPVYSHLPGLKPVSWEDIETAKAKYLMALDTDWLDRVRKAQALNRPGDIITLVQNPPTRWRESRIVYEAAKALIDLSRYSAAERVLRDVIRLDSENGDAQIELARVLSKLGETVTAERHLRELSQRYSERPQAANLLGQVSRHLWHLSWQQEREGDHVAARRRAKDASRIAISAIHSFLSAHRADPRSAYYAGFNALMLIYLLQEIDVTDFELPVTLDELKAMTRYIARHERKHAIKESDYEREFWSTTALGGLLFVEGDYQGSLSEIHKACAIPAASSFQLQSFRDRLVLLRELNVQPEFVSEALGIVDQAIDARRSHCSCQRVFLWSGRPIEVPGQSTLVQEQHADAVAKLMGKILTEECHVQAGDLAICAGTNESDVIFAETCRDLGARVRVLMRRPAGGEMNEPLWPFVSAKSNDRFHALMRSLSPSVGEQHEVWFDVDALGEPSDGSAVADPVRFADQCLYQWLINTAEMEADAARDGHQATLPSEHGARLHGVFLCGGEHDEQQARLIARVNEFDHYRGQVRTINLSEVEALLSVAADVS